MDDLNAQQIVLLTLLVSFVTSIATGITTVSLLEQAPEPVTQTINRVVEKTIERVVTEPAEDDGNDQPIEREVVTVVVNEEDRTIEAIEKNSPSLVRIYEKVTEDEAVFASMGIIISNTGTVITDAVSVNNGREYIAMHNSGEYGLDLISKEQDSQIAKLSINQTGTTTVQFVPAEFGNSDNLKLGQSVISLSGQSSNKVSIGVVSEIVGGGAEVAPLIDTSVSATNILPGSILLNLSGQIIGARITGSQNRPSSFIPINVLKSFLSTETAANIQN